MPVVKMKYGIDLGTTNSSLCKTENGVQTIIKTDTLKDTLPSCVSFTKNRIIKVGDAAYNDLRADKSKATKQWTTTDQNVFLEFKRTMGLDKTYKSTNMKRSYNSEELSAEVLKALLSFVQDEKINACVITIPAKFKTDQIAATMRAANLAGIAHCELLQEPIAAAIAYGVSVEQKDGLWLVFDFGGGTFDAALINVQDGILQVKDTEGDNYLGGKNIDYAIVDKIFIPYLRDNNTIDAILAKNSSSMILRDGLKFYAEQVKNQLSFEESCEITSQLDEFGNDDLGNEIELDLTVTSQELEEVVTPFFQKAVDICKRLLERNNVSSDQISSLILVGGPTHSPVLRRMLKEQITPNVDTSIDPMTAVALGSALYASTVDYNEEITALAVEDVVALEVTYESNSVESVEYVTIRPLPEESTGNVPANLTVELVRNDNAWSSGKVSIPEQGEVIECYLVEGRPNAFTINAFDESGKRVNCYPTEISILQGTKIVNAVLPYYIGIEIHNMYMNKDVFASLKGLEKNAIIPAVGVINDLRTPRELRVGNAEDAMIIPIYQGEYEANGSSAVYNDHVFDVAITGEDITMPVPSNTEIDIILRVDRSQMMSLEVTFPSTGEIVEKPVDVTQRKGVLMKDLNKFMSEAKAKLNSLKKSSFIDATEIELPEKMLKDIKVRFPDEKNFEDGRMHLLADIRRAFLEMEKIENQHGWDLLEPDLVELFERLVDINAHLGHKRDDEIDEVRKQYDEVMKSKDVSVGKRLYKDMDFLYFEITYVYQLMSFIREKYLNFDPKEWSNPTKAKAVLSDGYKLVNTGHFKPSDLRAILHDVMPYYIIGEGEKPISY